MILTRRCPLGWALSRSTNWEQRWQGFMEKADPMEPVEQVERQWCCSTGKMANRPLWYPPTKGGRLAMVLTGRRMAVRTGSSTRGLVMPMMNYGGSNPLRPQAGLKYALG